jgi:lipopolysaccharide biosynthesis regulator YciM
MALQKSHYHCELALVARAQGRSAEAAAHLKKAQSIHKGCVRAGHLQAGMAAAQGDHRSAIRLLRQTAEQEKEYLPEVLPEIVSAYRHLGEMDELRTYLEQVAEKRPGNGADLALAELLREKEGDAAAAGYLARRLGERPSLTLLARSIELNARLPDSQAQGFLDSLRPHIQDLLDQSPVYQCAHCGFAARTLHWQCPSCRRWSTVKRRAGCEPEI